METGGELLLVVHRQGTPGQRREPSLLLRLAPCMCWLLVFITLIAFHFEAPSSPNAAQRSITGLAGTQEGKPRGWRKMG